MQILKTYVPSITKRHIKFIYLNWTYVFITNEKTLKRSATTVTSFNKRIIVGTLCKY